jgi:hypothetical protein
MKKVILILIIGISIYFLGNINLFKSQITEVTAEDPDMAEYHAGDCFTIDNKLTFCLPVNSVSSEKMLSEMKSYNETTLFFHAITTNQLSNLTTVMVSKYEGIVPISIDSAFNKYLKYRAVDDSEKEYELLSCEKYTIGNKILYRKITKRKEDICSIMHYFMDNDFSKEVYEIKVGGIISEKDKLITLADAIALTATFKK